MKNLAVYIIRGLVLILCGLVFAWILSSCAGTKTVTVTQTRDSVRVEYRDRLVRDTTLRVDSVYVAHYVKEKGDTVHVIDTLYKYKVLHDTRDVYLHDSIYVTRTDSVPYPVEVERQVRVRNGYDRFTSWGFWILIALLLVRVAWWAFKTFYLHKT